LYGAVRHWVVL